MANADNAFAQATDNLIALYRSVERRTLDLPLVSVMPMLIFFWACLRFYFFFVIGVFLIIPTNLVILIRNLFPGRWKYRPFFLRHLYYTWLWMWRGEAPTAPVIFIRPLLNVFMKVHFESRLRRLRREILVHNELSEATRSALMARLDAALERWKSPKIRAVFSIALLPTIISLPKQLTEFLEWMGIHMPTDMVGILASMNALSTVLILSLSLGYLLAFPLTAFLAKRGLFLGRDPDRICFPGGQGDSGAYFKEREILGSVGLRAREAPIDFWLLGVSFVLVTLLQLSVWDHLIAWIRSYDPAGESQFVIGMIINSVLLVGLIVLAALRRGRTGRA